MRNDDPLWQWLAHRKGRAMQAGGCGKPQWPVCDVAEPQDAPGVGHSGQRRGAHCAARAPRIGPRHQTQNANP